MKFLIENYKNFPKPRKSSFLKQKSEKLVNAKKRTTELGTLMFITNLIILIFNMITKLTNSEISKLKHYFWRKKLLEKVMSLT